jgi:hypothetical protein
MKQFCRSSALALLLLCVCARVDSVNVGRRIELTSFPEHGSTDAIEGVFTSEHGPFEPLKAVLLMKEGDEMWIKPHPGASVPVASDGFFSFQSWASYPIADKAYQGFLILIVPEDVDIGECPC